MRKAQPFINGCWINSGRPVVQVRSPYSGEIIGEQLLSTKEDVENALSSAFQAKKEIAGIPVYERANILKKASSLLDCRKETFAKFISEELGKPLKNTLMKYPARLKHWSNQRKKQNG